MHIARLFAAASLRAASAAPAFAQATAGAAKLPGRARTRMTGLLTAAR